MSDPVVLAALLASMATIAVGIGGALLGRRWGLPGLGREVQTQQAALIQTLQAEIAELRAQQVTDDAKIRKLEKQSANLTEQLARAEARISRQQAELIDLYRLTGKTVPKAW